MEQAIPNDAHLEITGTADGKNVTLSGDVELIEVEVIPNYDDVYSTDFKVNRTSEDIWIKCKMAGSPKYTVKIEEGTLVERTASILATDRTAEALEAARIRAGAPKRAKFRFGDWMSSGDGARVFNVNEAHPISVEFYWEERV